MFKLLNSLSITILCAVFINGCLLQMNSDGTTSLNKHVSISAPTPTANSAEARKSNIIDDGWGGSPSSISSSDEKNSNTNVGWYTKKYLGKANERSLELKSPSYMEATCNESVKKQNRKALIESALTSVGVNLKPEAISQLSEKIVKDEYNKFEVSDCKPTSADGTFAECECALSYRVDGGKQSLIEKISSSTK